MVNEQSTKIYTSYGLTAMEVKECVHQIYDLGSKEVTLTTSELTIDYNVTFVQSFEVVLLLLLHQEFPST